MPIWPALNVLHALWYAPLNEPHKIEIWSGRGEGGGQSVREKTLRWLRGAYHDAMPHVGYFDQPPLDFFSPAHREKRIALRMREHGDYTPDNELKKKWLDQARAQERPPQLVFDDRQKVVDMWRAEGVPCFQVAPGDF